MTHAEPPPPAVSGLKLFHQYLIDLTLFMVLAILAALSLVASFNCYLGEPGWFQRSGSLIVVFGAIIQYRHFAFFRRNQEHNCLLAGTVSDARVLTFMAKGCHVMGLISIGLVIAGTVIWGYGDLPFSCVT